MQPRGECKPCVCIFDFNCRDRRPFAAQKNTSNSCRLYVLMPSSSSRG